MSSKPGMATIVLIAFAATVSISTTYARDEGNRSASLLAPADPILVTPLVWSVVTGPVMPVVGTDGKVHLAYEIMVTNVTADSVEIKAVEVVDPARSNRIVGKSNVVAIDGADVSGLVRRLGQKAGEVTMSQADYANRLEGGRSGLIYVDVTLDDEGQVPRSLAHRLSTASAALTDTKSDGIASPTHPEGSGPVISAIGAPVKVSRQSPVVLGPPLKGSGWFNGSGCCRIVGPHRYSLLPIAGTLRPPEHFAIDFVQFNREGRLFTGDPLVLANWVFYGAEVIAAGAGVVVRVLDDLPDQVPGSLPESITADTAAGNYVIVDMGHGRYALYAHMIPRSIVVRVGDHVSRGQRLGKLGNSGNSDAPHLHFQVMNSASPLDAVGLPFVFERMVLQGRAAGTLGDLNKLLMSGGAAQIDSSHAGPRGRQMPLTLDVLEFR